jgi:DNA-binding MarR family transcriptional regulator
MPNPPPEDYVLDRQVGFLLRRATQRHLGIFSQMMELLTPTQFAAIAKLHELGPISQNALGRETAMDAATIKGVIDRLREKGLVHGKLDKGDRRRIVLDLTDIGRSVFAEARVAGHKITKETLSPLNDLERQAFLMLLEKLC